MVVCIQSFLDRQYTKGLVSRERTIRATAPMFVGNATRIIKVKHVDLLPSSVEWKFRA